MTGILILIGRLRFYKEAKLMDMLLDKSIFHNRVRYVVGAHWNCIIEVLPHRGNSNVYQQHMPIH